MNKLNISEIFIDALRYPFNNVRSLAVYIMLSIIAAFSMGGTVIGVLFGISANDVAVSGGFGFFGFLLFLIISLLISGYELDIIKLAIRRVDDSPDVDFIRQISNGLKLIVVRIVYYIIPIILGLILGSVFGYGTLTFSVVIIFVIIFSFSAIMGQCRLANSDSLFNALSVLDAVVDIKRVGIFRLIISIIVILLLVFVFSLIFTSVSNINNVLGSIVLAILFVYLLFFEKRLIGLLYSYA